MSRSRSEDEAYLIRLAAQCNDEAFAALCARYRRLLYGIAARFASCPDDREDLRSEVITKLLENRKQALRDWRPLAPFLAYLTAIASRHCLLRTRQDARISTVSLTPVATDEGVRPLDLLERLIPEDHSGEPQVAIERSELHTALARAVAELSETDRLILAMRFEDGMDGPTMASVLGITHGAVRQRLFKAVRRLEDTLQRRHPDMFEAPDR